LTDQQYQIGQTNSLLCASYMHKAVGEKLIHIFSTIIFESLKKPPDRIMIHYNTSRYCSAV